MKLIHVILALSGFLMFLTTGCGGAEKTNKNDAPDSVQMIQITKHQFEAEGMKTGEATMQHFEDEVRCNGYITAPANGMAQLSAPLSGIVKNINCSNGEYVRKGQTLCMITSNDLMVLQQNFAETSAKLKRLKSDYDRSKTLYDEKIGAGKDFLAVESDYKAMSSLYQSLKIRLEQLKLNPSDIEAGVPYSAYAVISPINGYITSLDLVLGQYAEQQKSLVEIVDVNQLQLQLLVFEHDVSKLTAGQKVRFNSLGEPADAHEATIISIGKTINPESRSIRCIAKIQSENDAGFINQSYVEATIKVAQKEAMALPNEAILKSGKDHYIFVIENQNDQTLSLRREKVTIGRASKDFTEIAGRKDNAKILIKGVYNLPLE
jgi:cobalt-zinc-cadmium efflux system membrane fusion protein